MMGRRCYVLLRRRYDVPIRRHRDAPLRRLGDVPSKCRWVFHLRRTWDVTGTYRQTSLRRRHDVLMPGGNKFKKQVLADFKLGVLKNLVNSTAKHLCWSLFLIKLQA